MRNKSFLFFFNGKYPDGMAMSHRIHLYGKCLYAAGLQVYVVVPGEKRVGEQRWHEEVPYSVIRDPIVFRNYLLRQINGFFAAFIYAWHFFVLAKKHSVIFICGLGWFASLLAVFGGQAGGARMVMEVNENPYAPEGGRLDPVLIRKVRRWLMLNITFRFADGFVVISQKLKDLVARYKNRSAQIVYVPILVNDAMTNKKVVQAPDVPYLLHSGALSETKDGMVAVFEAFAMAHKALDGHLKFYLTERQMCSTLSLKLKHIVKVHKLAASVCFTGYLPREELDSLRRQSSLAIVNKPSNWQNDYNFPTKWGEYLADGIPTVVASTGEMSKYVKDMETAFVVTENDAAAMAERIVFVIKHPKAAAQIGEAGRQLAYKEFCYKNYSEVMKSFFLKLLN
jgi:glycosyltransferase involved in cell wall biosynthesis